MGGGEDDTKVVAVSCFASRPNSMQSVSEGWIYPGVRAATRGRNASGQIRPRDTLCLSLEERFVGLVVKASASTAEDPGFEFRLRRDFSGSSHTSDLNMGTPVATLPGAWRFRVGAETGRPGVSILCLGEMESLVCNFYLSVAARKIV